NTTTVISVGQARGIALLVAAEVGLKVHEYKPMQVKQAVHGYGLATKQQVGEMVRILLELPYALRPDDASDAAAIAICHLIPRGFPDNHCTEPEISEENKA